MLAAVSGNETLMAQALRKPKPVISPAAELDILRRPFQEKRRMLASELNNVQKQLTDEWVTNKPELIQRRTDLQQELRGLLDQEEERIAEFRQVGGVSTQEEQVPRQLPPPITTYPTDWSPEERKIQDILRSRGMSVPIRGELPTTTDVFARERQTYDETVTAQLEKIGKELAGTIQLQSGEHLQRAALDKLMAHGNDPNDPEVQEAAKQIVRYALNYRRQ